MNSARRVRIDFEAGRATSRSASGLFRFQGAEMTRICAEGAPTISEWANIRERIEFVFTDDNGA